MLVLIAVLLATAIGQPVSSPIDPADDIVNPTNIVRAQYCLPPVAWDPALAQLADIWAKQCTYASSDPGIRDLSYFDILSNLGQNIPNPLRTGESVAAAFGQQITNTAFELQGNDWNCSTNVCAANKTCDSYTQLVNLPTTKVGCARYICDVNSPFPGGATPWRILVCNYYQPGPDAFTRPFPSEQCKNCSSFVPTNAPTKAPTGAPTTAPTTAAPTPPTNRPTTGAPTPPTSAPSGPPTDEPTPPTPEPVAPTEPPTPAPTEAPIREAIDPYKDIVNDLNDLRAEYCLPPIVWDSNLEDLADVYASTCPWSRSDRLDRANLFQAILTFNSQPRVPPLFTGETLAATIGQEVTANPWIVQQDNWDCATNTCQAGKKCDSFTQIVDLVTTKVGCARYLCSNPSPFPSMQTPWRLMICEFYQEQNTTAPSRPFNASRCTNCSATIPTNAPTKKPTPSPTAAPTKKPGPPTKTPTSAPTPPTLPPPPTIPPPTSALTAGPTAPFVPNPTNQPTPEPTERPTTLPPPTTFPPPTTQPPPTSEPTEAIPTSGPTVFGAPTVPTVPVSGVPTVPTIPGVPTEASPTVVGVPTANTPFPTNNPTQGAVNNEGGLSTAAVIGIVVGSVIAFIIIVAIIAILVSKAALGSNAAPKSKQEYELL